MIATKLSALRLLNGVRDAWTQIVGFGDAAALAVVFVRFDKTLFVPGDFDRIGIDFPPAIRRSVAGRQAEFYFGRLAARAALEAVGYAPATIGIGDSREPLWPSGVSGSISHSGDLAAAVACLRSSHAGVGLDIENITGPGSHSAIEQLVINNDELCLIERVAGEISRNDLIALAFSAKESLFKGAFSSVGHYFDFGAARLISIDVAAKRIELMIMEPLSDDYPVGRKCCVSFCSLSDGTLLTAFGSGPRK